MAFSLGSLLTLALVLSPAVSSYPTFSRLARRYQDCHHDWTHIIDCTPDPSAQPTRTGIAPALLARFARYTAFANLAYAGANTDPLALTDPPRTMGCNPSAASTTCRSAERLERAGALSRTAVVWATYGPLPQGDGHAYIALPADTPEIVLAVRGSATPSNWIVNFNVWRTDIDWCDGCGVHHGFWKSWMALRGQAIRALEELRATYPERERIVITGHSLGGAVATLAAAELRRMHPNWNIEMFNQGSPRLANYPLANYLTAASAANPRHPNYRVTAANDPIPRLPPAAGTGYLHPAPEYYLADDGADPQAGNVRVADGLYSNDGNSKDGGRGFAGWRVADWDGDGEMEEEVGFRHQRYFADWTGWPERVGAWTVTSEGPWKGTVVDAEGRGQGAGRDAVEAPVEEAGGAADEAEAPAGGPGWTWTVTSDGPLKGKEIAA